MLCRPQFDDSAVAVIVTKQEKVRRYEKMMSGDEILESWSVSHIRSKSSRQS